MENAQKRNQLNDIAQSSIRQYLFRLFNLFRFMIVTWLFIPETCSNNLVWIKHETWIRYKKMYQIIHFKRKFSKNMNINKNCYRADFLLCCKNNWKTLDILLDSTYIYLLILYLLHFYTCRTFRFIQTFITFLMFTL